MALYAIGVFTGFAMAGAGMVKHHLDAPRDHWRRGVVVNAISAFLTALIVLIFATVKFTEGAWVVVIVGPLMYFGLIRLHRQYVSEEHQLEEGAAEAAEAPVLSRHVVVVLVDRLDMATARALQYARTLHPDELRAVHFVLDAKASAELEAEWRRLGLTQLPLDIEECEDRRLTRAALELAAETVADGQTELTILLPRRGFAAGWQRVLHDATADHIADAVGQLDHVNATVVPYQLTGGWFSRRREWRRKSVPPESVPAAGRADRSSDRAADKEAAAQAAFDRIAFGDPGPGTTPSARPSGATGSGWPGGCGRSGSSPGPAPPTSSACWPTTPASSSWCSRAGGGSPGSSPGPGWWWRAWWATGPAARPSSTPTTSSSPAPRPTSSPPERPGGPGAGPSGTPSGGAFLAPRHPLSVCSGPVAGFGVPRGAPRRVGHAAVTAQGESRVFSSCGGPRSREPPRIADRDRLDRADAVHRREPHR